MASSLQVSDEEHFAGAAGPRYKELGIRGVRRVILDWVAQQDPYTQSLFCTHGRYVGRNGRLAFLCPRCDEGT